MNEPFLVGERIYLRPLDEGDLDRCLRWINDAGILARLGRRTPMSRAMEREWLANQYRSDRDLNMAIVVSDGDRHIGNCGFNEIDHPNRSGVFGILIGERDAWGKGYGPEAARLVLEYGFGELNLHRISLCVHADNERAIRAYEKVGFRREGVLRDAYYRHGRYHDTLIMAVLASEWPPAEPEDPRSGGGERR